MTNIRILASNVAAARDKTRLSLEDCERLNRYAQQTAAEYCAGCSRICESLLATRVPVGDIMRHLMYARSYSDPERAAALFQRIPAHRRRRMANVDYRLAERFCPQGMPIGKLMGEALFELDGF